MRDKSQKPSPHVVMFWNNSDRAWSAELTDRMLVEAASPREALRKLAEMLREAARLISNEAEEIPVDTVTFG